MWQLWWLFDLIFLFVVICNIDNCEACGSFGVCSSCKEGYDPAQGGGECLGKYAFISEQSLNKWEEALHMYHLSFAETLLKIIYQCVYSTQHTIHTVHIARMNSSQSFLNKVNLWWCGTASFFWIPPVLMYVMDNGCVPCVIDNYMITSYRYSLSEPVFSFVLENILSLMYGDRVPFICYYRKNSSINRTKF